MVAQLKDDRYIPKERAKLARVAAITFWELLKSGRIIAALGEYRRYRHLRRTAGSYDRFVKISGGIPHYSGEMPESTPYDVSAMRE